MEWGITHTVASSSSSYWRSPIQSPIPLTMILDITITIITIIIIVVIIIYLFVKWCCIEGSKWANVDLLHFVFVWIFISLFAFSQLITGMNCILHNTQTQRPGHSNRDCISYFFQSMHKNLNLYNCSSFDIPNFLHWKKIVCFVHCSV